MNLGSVAWLSAEPQPANAAAMPAITTLENMPRHIRRFYPAPVKIARALRSREELLAINNR
jgi:hypothetical protein